MAHRTASAPLDAGNIDGTLVAAVNAWYRGVADLHVGTGHSVPIEDAGYTTASESRAPQLSISLYLQGESIYAYC